MHFYENFTEEKYETILFEYCSIVVLLFQVKEEVSKMEKEGIMI